MLPPEHGDADAGRASVFSAGKLIRVTDGGKDFLADSLGLFRHPFNRFTQLFDEHNELVSAQSGHGVGLAHTGDKTRGDFLQKEVADGMATAVVQGFEVI